MAAYNYYTPVEYVKNTKKALSSYDYYININ